MQMLTVDELAKVLGQKIREARIEGNLGQQEMAERAGISRKSLSNLETGKDVTVTTLLAVVRALGREVWVEQVAPVSAVNPFTLLPQAKPRQRAFKHRAPRRVA